MANQDIKMRVKYTAEFDTSQVSNGLKEIRKQMSNSHIGDDLRKQFETALNKVEVNIPALKKFAEKGEYNSKELEAFQKVILQVSKDMQALDKLAGEANFTKVFSEIDTVKVKEFEKQLENVENKIKSFKKEIIESTEQVSGKKITGGMEDIVEQLLSVNPNEIEKRFDEIVEETIIKSEQAKREIEEALSNRSKSFKQNSDVIDFLYGKDSGVTINRGFGGKAVEALQQAKEAIQNLNKGEDIEDASKKLERLYQLVTGTGEFEGAFNNPDGIKSAFEGITSAIQSGNFDKIKDLLPTLKEFSEKKFSFIEEAESERIKISGEYAVFLNERLQSLTKTGQLTKEQIELVSKELGTFNNKTKEGIEYTKSEESQIKALNATFGSLASRIEHTVSAMAVFNKSMQIVRQAIRSVEELDAAFTQIAIVSEQSGEAAWKMFDSFNSLARQYSITTKDLTEGAKLFYQQGLSAADTMKMVEASTVSAALGEVTMTEAANTLTAAIQGYNESASVAMDYTDKIAMVGAVSAADFNELSTAMEKTASSAYTAGIDFDHLLGYLGKMIEVTREAPANLGTAMKTIIARFEDMKKDPGKALEDGISFNKVEEALKTLGIALRDTTGEFRPLQEVFDELGMKWESLTRNQQAYIATVAAGSRQQSRFLAMMNNYPRTLDLITEAQNSAGAAARQYATYQDSIAAAQARLTASWEKFYSKIVDNDAIKIAINGLSDLIETLSHIPPSITAIGTTLGALKLQSFLANNGGLIKILSGLLGGTGESIEKNGVELGKRLIENIHNGIDKYSTLGKDTKFFKDFKEMMKLEGVSVGKNVAENLSSTFSKFGTILTSIPGKITNIAMALKGLVLTHPIITAVAASVAALTIAITAVHKIANKAKEDSKKSAEELSRLNEELDQTSNKLNNLESLMTSYDKLNSKAERTEEEQQELNGIIQQIGETSDIAKISVDNYGNSHLDNVEKIEQEIEALERYNELLEFQEINEKKKFLQNTKGMTSETASTAGETGLASALKLKEDFDKTDDDIKSLRKRYEEIREAEYDLKSLNLNNIIENYDIPLNNMTEIAEETYLSLSEQLMLGVEGVTEKQVEEAKEAYILALQNSIESFINQFDEINKLIEEEKSNSFKDLLMTELKKDKNIDKDTLAFFDSFDLEITDFNEYLEAYQKISEWYQKIQDFPKEQQKKYEELIKSYNAGEISTKELSKGLEDLEIAVDSYTQNLIDSKIKEIEDEKTSNEEGKLNSLNKRREDIRNSTGSGANFKFISSNELDFYDSISAVLSEDSKKRLLRDFGKGKNDSSIIESSQNLAKAAAEYSWGTVLETIQNITDYLEKLGFSNEQINEVISGMIPDLQDKINQSINQLTSTSIPKADTYAGEITTEQYQNYADKLGGYENIGLDFNEEGKVVLDTFTQVELILKDIEDRNAEIDNVINAVNTKLITQSDLSEEEKEILRKTIEVLKDQKTAFQDIINNTKTQIGLSKELNGEYKGIAKNAKALQFSADYAKEFKEVVNLAKEMQDQMDKLGQVDSDLMNQLLEMGPVFQEFFHVNDDGSVEMVLSEQLSQYQNAAEAITDIQRKRQEVELEIKRQELEAEAKVADAKAELYKTTADIYLELSQAQTKEEFDNIKKRAEADIKEKGTAVDNAQKTYNEIISASEQAYTYLSQLDASFWAKLGKAEMKNFVADTISGFRVAEGSATDILTELQGLTWEENGKEKAKELEAQYRNAEKLQRNLGDRLREAAKNLKIIDPIVFDDLKKKFDETGKEGTDAMSKIADAVEDLIDALEDLDKFLVNIKRDFKDISVDIDPFKDIFEQWEHEWDYFYNIKTLISNISRSRNMFSQISEAEWASPQQRMEADRAILGTAMADASARKKYAEGLMAAIIQKGTDMTEKYGQFGRFDPTSMTWYQRPDSLPDINAEQAKNVAEINRLQEEQWHRGNDLATEQAKLEALEKEKSGYEEILSIMESQRDTLQDNEDINYDTSDIEAKIAAEKGVIEAIDGQIDAQKDLIKTIEDELKDIDFDLYAAQGAYDFWDDFVNDMEEDISNLNDMIADYYDNVSEVMEDANTYWEMYTKYIETTINTEQELYDAIVENYQNEIDQKKKQYDELKKLDNDYLQTVKDNIAKERQARDDSTKQKSYQQNLQRAQLLAQDTSGAYRKELANLKKDIESQRQDLYDDLVDKQVEALEKEIEKRHELYDKEVVALEDRLTYMQENAILLWEMVDNIVAEGAESMMATLESTNNYINSNERSKEQQRRIWESNVQKTVKTVTDDTVEQWGILAKVLGEIGTQTFPNYKAEVDNYTATLTEAEQAMISYRQVIDTEKGNIDEVMSDLATSLSTKMEEYMTEWAGATSKFTGNVSAYGEVVNNMIASTSTNITTLEGWNKGLEVSGGKIIKTIEYYDEELAKKYAEIYKTYEEERNAHKEELEGLIRTIQEEITAAAQEAADAIRKAVEGLQSSSQPKPADTGTKEPSGQTIIPTDTGTKQPSNGNGSGQYKGWKADFDNGTGSGVYQQTQIISGAGGLTREQVFQDWINTLNNKRKQYPTATSAHFTPFFNGGFANFTGPAWLDGTKSQPEAVLNAKQTRLFTSMVSSLEKASNNSNINSALGSSYNIGDINTNINVERLDNETDIDKVARQVENRILKSIRNRVSVAIA